MTDKEAPTNVFRHSHRVSEAEIDELGHVSNSVYVQWISRAALQHSTSVGYDFQRYIELGQAFVVRRHEVDYLYPAKMGDEVLIDTWLESWTSIKSTRRTIISRKDGKELARATTIWVMVSLDTGRPRRIPKDIQQAFEK